MNTSYRILKLKSGEQLIASITGSNKDKLIVFRPMIFKNTLITDMSGRQREITVLRNWLAYTNQIETKIPKDFIVSYLDPDEDVKDLYELEKEKEDVQVTKPQIIDKKKLNEENMDDKQKSFMDFMSQIKDNFESKEDLQDMLDDLEDEMEEELENMNLDPNGHPLQNLITMTMFLPPEALMTLVDAGLIDAADIKDLIDTMNNNMPYKKPDKKRQSDEDFGNEWTDWSPDISDYFKED